jgi:hypothetical protein
MSVSTKLYEEEGVIMKTTDSQELTMKKLTLTAWARLLHRNGMIDAAKLGRMITLIEKMKETEHGNAASESA